MVIDYDSRARSEKAQELSNTPYLRNVKWWSNGPENGGYKACVHAELPDDYVFGLFIDPNFVHWYVCKKPKGWDTDPREAISECSEILMNSADIPIESANVLTMASCLMEHCKKLGIVLEGVDA